MDLMDLMDEMDALQILLPGPQGQPGPHCPQAFILKFPPIPPWFFWQWPVPSLIARLNGWLWILKTKGDLQSGFIGCAAENGATNLLDAPSLVHKKNGSAAFTSLPA